MADVIALPGNGKRQLKRVRAGSVKAHFAYDIDTIKDDLGIPAADTTNDAWLDRRIAGIWSRFETYTSRYLAVPPAQFIDDWGEIASTYHVPNQPPPLEQPSLGSPFLRCAPVVSIDAVKANAQTLDPAGVRFDVRSGKLFSLTENWPGGHDVSQELRQGEVAITYTAGWDEIPPDLYEALLGALGVLWSQRAGQQATGGAGIGGVTSINVVDVGTVDIANEGNAFVSASTRGVRINDPLLGPWSYLLDPYIDVRVQIGSPLIPTTVYVPPPP